MKKWENLLKGVKRVVRYKGVGWLERGEEKSVVKYRPYGRGGGSRSKKCKM